MQPALRLGRAAGSARSIGPALLAALGRAARGAAGKLVSAARAAPSALGGWLWVPLVGRLLLWLLLFVGLAHVGAGTVGRLLGLTSTRLAVAQLAQADAPQAIGPADGSREAPPPAASEADCHAQGLACGPPRGEPRDAGADAAAEPARLPDGRVVLNLASEAELMELPGIGPKRAQAIVALRAKIGRFRRLEDLLRVRGIGPKALARLRPLVVLDSPRAESETP